MIEKYIDTSSISLFIGIVVFIGIFFLSRYLFNMSKPVEDEEENSSLSENKIIGISVAIAFVAAGLSLVGYKKYQMYKGSNTFSDVGYYEP